MHRYRVRLVTVGFLVVMAAAMPMSGRAQEATPAAPHQPTQPSTGPGSSEAHFSGITSIEQVSPGQTIADYWLLVPSDPLPGTATEGDPFPMVIFLHGSGATGPDRYLAWVEHLVWRGAVVLFPMYERPTAEGYLDYQQTIQDDVRAGLEMLEREGVPVDLTRVAVVGHSLGAEQALVYAASAATADLPVPAAVMSVAAGCFPMEAGGPCFEVDLGAIPESTRLLLVSEEDDLGTTGTALIWAELRGVPLENRDVLTLVSDNHGKPPLMALHVQALAGPGRFDKPNAFDWYGTWKWLDALMGCAFDGEWCQYALGNTPEQRFMGEWSDGVPVAEPLVTDEPA